MRVVSLRTLRAFWQEHADAEVPLRAWYALARKARWRSPQEIKTRIPHASILDSKRIVFNIGGNKYRLVVKAWFDNGSLWIKFVGTHAEYDKIDATKL